MNLTLLILWAMDYFIIVWDFINYAREKNIPIGP